MAELKLAQCPRCKAYGLVGKDVGIRIALDVAPVDAVAFGSAVASGVGLYWVRKSSGRPLEHLGAYSASRKPSWGPGGSQTGSQLLHAEHSCGALARDMVILSVTSPKDSAPATPGAPGAGNLLRRALAVVEAERERPSPATPATRRPSRPPVCEVCDKVIAIGAQYWAIECPPGTYAWAVHEDCP